MVVDLRCTRTHCSVDFFLLEDRGTYRERLRLEDRQTHRERLRQRVYEVLHTYRDDGRPFSTHSVGNPSWSILSCPLSPVIWFLYYRMLENFIRSITDITSTWHPTLYIHATVFVPFLTTLHADLRLAVYRMFYHNTPYSVWHFIRANRFRVLFVASTSFGDLLRIERLRLTSESSYPVYPGSDLLCES